jgi:hypothetical protein
MLMPRSAKLQSGEVVREIERLAHGTHLKQQTPLMRFTQCPDWQNAAVSIIRALDASLHRRPRGVPISPPPGWLPPAA